METISEWRKRRHRTALALAVITTSVVVGLGVLLYYHPEYLLFTLITFFVLNLLARVYSFFLEVIV